MSVDDAQQLEQPLKDGGIRSVNFFNGRLLTSRDLTRVEQARRESDWRLGLAVGDGVAVGLDVNRDVDLDRPGTPVVRIGAGLAVNRRGQTLRLAADTSVALRRRFESTTSNCLFAQCEPISGGTYVAGAGVYVLTVAPAEAGEGRAATNGLDPLDVRCNTDATVEAVQFRLLWVNPLLYAGLDLGSVALRNDLAYRCFGADLQASWFAGLIDATPRRAGLLDALRKTTLSDFDVPLALLFIRGIAEIDFIDAWSVRRPLTRDSASQWTNLVDSQREAVGYAMFMQFQRHVMSLAQPNGSLGSLTARSHFRYLPPVGVIPVPEEPADSDTQTRRFFTGMTARGPAFINAACLEDLVRESLHFPPIDTHSPEMLWLYRVRENQRVVDVAGSGLRPRTALVFASGHLPYRADARFDLAYWNYGNYALAR